MDDNWDFGNKSFKMFVYINIEMVYTWPQILKCIPGYDRGGIPVVEPNIPMKQPARTYNFKR